MHISTLTRNEFDFNFNFKLFIMTQNDACTTFRFDLFNIKKKRVEWEQLNKGLHGIQHVF